MEKFHKPIENKVYWKVVMVIPTPGANAPKEPKEGFAKPVSYQGYAPGTFTIGGYKESREKERPVVLAAPKVGREIRNKETEELIELGKLAKEYGVSFSVDEKGAKKIEIDPEFQDTEPSASAEEAELRLQLAEKEEEASLMRKLVPFAERFAILKNTTEKLLPAIKDPSLAAVLETLIEENKRTIEEFKDTPREDLLERLKLGLSSLEERVPTDAEIKQFEEMHPAIKTPVHAPEAQEKEVPNISTPISTEQKIKTSEQEPAQPNENNLFREGESVRLMDAETSKIADWKILSITSGGKDRPAQAIVQNSAFKEQTRTIDVPILRKFVEQTKAFEAEKEGEKKGGLQAKASYAPIKDFFAKFNKKTEYNPNQVLAWKRQWIDSGKIDEYRKENGNIQISDALIAHAKEAIDTYVQALQTDGINSGVRESALSNIPLYVRILTGVHDKDANDIEYFVKNNVMAESHLQTVKEAIENLKDKTPSAGIPESGSAPALQETGTADKFKKTLQENTQTRRLEDSKALLANLMEQGTGEDMGDYLGKLLATAEQKSKELSEGVADSTKSEKELNEINKAFLESLERAEQALEDEKTKREKINSAPGSSGKNGPILRPGNLPTNRRSSSTQDLERKDKIMQTFEEMFARDQKSFMETYTTWDESTEGYVEKEVLLKHPQRDIIRNILMAHNIPLYAKSKEWVNYDENKKRENDHLSLTAQSLVYRPHVQNGATPATQDYSPEERADQLAADSVGALKHTPQGFGMTEKSVPTTESQTEKRVTAPTETKMPSLANEPDVKEDMMEKAMKKVSQLLETRMKNVKSNPRNFTSKKELMWTVLATAVITGAALSYKTENDVQAITTGTTVEQTSTPEVDWRDYMNKENPAEMEFVDDVATMSADKLVRKYIASDKPDVYDKILSESAYDMLKNNQKDLPYITNEQRAKMSELILLTQKISQSINAPERIAMVKSGQPYNHPEDWFVPRDTPEKKYTVRQYIEAIQKKMAQADA